MVQGRDRVFWGLVALVDVGSLLQWLLVWLAGGGSWLRAGSCGEVGAGPNRWLFGLR